MAVDLHYDMYDRDIHVSLYGTYQRLLRESPLYFNDELKFCLR